MRLSPRTCPWRFICALVPPRFTFLSSSCRVFTSSDRQNLEVEKFFQNLHGFLRALDGVANGSLVAEDLVVVAALEGLVTKEMDVLVGDSVGLLGLVFEVAQAVSLVPASGEDIEGDLAADGETAYMLLTEHRQKQRDEFRMGKGKSSNIRKSQVAEFLLENSNELLSNLGILVVGLKLVSLLGAGVSADGADVDHAVTELNKGSSLDRDVQVGNVVQDEVGKLLVLVLTNPLDEAVGGERLAQLVCGQAVLGEAVVEEGGDRHAGGLAELLLLLDEVGAADETNGALLAEGLEEVEDFGRGILAVLEMFC